MKLVVGLGNPGHEYRDTRHNVGFRIAERFARSAGIPLGADRFGGRYGAGVLREDSPDVLEVGILLPETFMNRSGVAVGAACEELVIDRGDIVVVFDDLDLPLGRIRIRPAGGAGGHRGLGSVLDVLGTPEIARLRFGIGRPKNQEAPRDSGTRAEIDFVLSRFDPVEEAILTDRIGVGACAVRAVLVEGVVAAMNRFNPDPQPLS